MVSTHRKPFVSIVIPVYNQLEYTGKCIDSLLHDNDRPFYEIIIVDNGSTDGTGAYLESMSKSMQETADKLIPIYNAGNLGVAPAWNQGVSAATTDYIAILNNDIVVSHGWMRSLLWAMENYQLHLVSPFAATGSLNYELDERAERFTGKNIHKVWFEEYDFCAFLAPRRVYEKIGAFDENFKVGGYEDTDYCYRLKKEGKRFGVVGASFIHHFGSSTLSGFKKCGDKHASGNKSYFISKWGEDPSCGAHSVFAKARRTYRKMKLQWDRM